MATAESPQTRIEPPYGVIWRRLKRNGVVPFLGAGASLVGRTADTEWGRESSFLPTGKELAHFLGGESQYPSKDPQDWDDLAKVSSYYSDVSGREDLRLILRELLNRKYSPGPVHEFLASLDGPRVFVVTNYDTLLEQAFEAVGKPYDLVVYASDSKKKDTANTVLWRPSGATPQAVAPNELHIDLKTTTVIFKMHGTVLRDTAEYDSFVITEEDYVEFLSRMTTQTAIPSLFTPYLQERSFLFLGYSLRDWNLRVVLRNISKLLKDRTDDLPSWAIQYHVSELDRKLWDKRGVQIYDLAIDEFISKLRECLSA